MIELKPSWHLFSKFCLFLPLAFLMGLTACNAPDKEVYPDPPPETARKRYLAALDSLGLSDSRLVQRWRAAGEETLKDSILITPPFRETAYVRAEEPAAFSYRLRMQEGEELRLYLDPVPADIIFFLDLYEVITTDSTETARRIFSAEEEETDSLTFEARETGQYLIRLQPELLADCRFTLTLVLQPAYGVFPVSGKGNPDVWSFFGDPRDGGSRSHKGIDIFARRGTPVLAATDGYIRSVRNRGKGGKQVWLHDYQREQSLYYAHLDSQLVEQGAQVYAGDTLGLVGNTGNASGTRPHLHFSIYRRGRGAVDPYAYVARRSDRLPGVLADTAWLGQLVRIKQEGTPLQIAPENRSEALQRLPLHLPLRIVAASRDRYRVITPQGAEGYVAASRLERTDRSLRQLTIAEESELLMSPIPNAESIGSIQPEEEVEVIGQSEGFQLVRNGAGIRGWVTTGK